MQEQKILHFINKLQNEIKQNNAPSNAFYTLLEEANLDELMEYSYQQLSAEEKEKIQDLGINDYKLTQTVERLIKKNEMMEEVSFLPPQQKDNAWELDVPADNGCLFWAITLSYLVPVVNNEEEFLARIATLFGELEFNKLQRIKHLIKSYNPCSDISLFDNEELKYLVRETFRNRIINYMSNAQHIKDFWGASNNKREKSFEEYLLNMRDSNAWGGELEIKAISEFLSCNIHILSDQPFIYSVNSNSTIKLVHVNGNRDSLTKKHYHFELENEVFETYLVKPKVSIPLPVLPARSQPLSKPLNKETQVYNLPDRNSNFTGRLNELTKLKSLAKNSKGIITQNIIGQGGVGKSQLAFEFANWAKEENVYDYIIVLNAEVDLIGEYRKFAEKKLKLEVDKLNSEELLQKIYVNLTNQKALIILDNVNNEAELSKEHIVPTAKENLFLQFIITSRSQHWGMQYELIKLDVFEEKEALQYLQKALNQEPNIYNENDGEKLINGILGRLPLAITQAAAFMVNALMSINDYMLAFKESQENTKELLDQIPETDPHEKTVFVTLSLILQKIETLSPESIKILNYISFLSFRFIPKLFITDVLKIVNKLSMAKAVNLCNDYSLFEIDQIPDYIKIHPLTQAVVRLNMSQNEYDLCLNHLLQIFENAFPSDILSYPELWSWQSLLFPHALEFVKLIKNDGKYSIHKLVILAGIIQHIIHVEQNDYEKGLSLLAEAKKINNTYKASDIEAYNKIMLSLTLSEALLLIDKAKTDKGLKLLFTLLEDRYIQEDKDRQSHILFYIGNTKKRLALYDDAEFYLHQIENMSVASHTLGEIYYIKGNYSKAEACLRKSLEFKREEYKNFKHPQLAVTMRMLANVLAVQGKFIEANLLFNDAIVITEAVFGTKYHEVVKLNIIYYADALYRQGNYVEALKQYNHALKIEESLSKLHNKDLKSIILNELVSKLYNKLSYFYDAYYELKEVETKYRQAQIDAGYKEIKRDPLICLYLGHTLALLNYCAAAENYLNEALLLFDESGTLKESHNYTTCLLYLGDLYIRQQYWPEAKAMLEETLALQYKAYPNNPNHPHIAFTLRNLALVHQADNASDQAQECLQQALAIQRLAYQTEENIEILITKRQMLSLEIDRTSNIAVIHGLILTLKNIISAQIKLYDNEEKDEIAASYQLLALCYAKLAKFNDGIIEQKKAVDILTKIFIRPEKQDHKVVIAAKEYLLSLFCENNDIANAISIAEELVNALPGNGSHIGNLACLYHISALMQTDAESRQALLAKAQENFLLALRICQRPEIYCDYAIYFCKQNCFKEALTALNSALACRDDAEGSLIYTPMESIRLDNDLRSYIAMHGGIILSARVMMYYLLINICLNFNQLQLATTIKDELFQIIDDHPIAINQEIAKIIQNKLASFSHNPVSEIDIADMQPLFNQTSQLLGGRMNSKEEIQNTEIVLRDPGVMELLNLCKENEISSTLSRDIVKRAETLLANFEKGATAVNLALFTAANNYNTSIVKSLIENRLVLPNATDENGNSLLHIAVSTNNLELFELCKPKTNHNIKNRFDQNILHIAVINNNIEFLNKAIDLQLSVVERAKFLLRISDNENSGIAISMQPLHYAVYAGHIPAIECLLNSPALTKSHIDEDVPSIGNLFHVAVAGGHPDVIHVLFRDPRVHSLINKRNDVNFSPLGAAAYSGQIDMIKTLVQKDGQLVPKDTSIIPPLHCAVYACNYAVVLEVLSYMQYHPEALERNLNKKYSILAKFGLTQTTQEYTAIGLTKKLSKAVSTVSDLSGLQKQKMAAEWSAIKGFLENIERLVNSAVFNDQQEFTKQLNNLINAEQQSQLATRYKNLVLQGGGPKGIAYIGAIQGLEKNLGKGLPNIKRIAGTSAGAITALLLALGLDGDAIQGILENKKLTDFIEASFDPNKVRKASSHLSLFNGIKVAANVIYSKFKRHHKTESFPKAAFHALSGMYYMDGLCPGEDFRLWLEKLITEKTGKEYLTFEELHELVKTQPTSGRTYKELYIATTQLLPTPSICILNSEKPIIKDLIISDAIRASMSIPGVFEPHRLHFKKDGKRYVIEENYYVDGGLLYNYPIQMFDNVQFHPFGFGMRDTSSFYLPNRETLGLSLYTPEELVEKPLTSISNVKELLKAIGSIYNDAEHIYAQLLRPIDAERTIKISNLGVGLFDFDIPKEKQGNEKVVTQGDLIHEGYSKTDAFLQSSIENAPENNNQLSNPIPGVHFYQPSNTNKKASLLYAQYHNTEDKEIIEKAPPQIPTVLEIQQWQEDKKLEKLCDAAIFGNVILARNIIQAGVDIDGKLSNLTPLQFAIISNKMNMVLFLLENNANINNIRETDGCNVLHLIAQNGKKNEDFEDMITFLLEKGIDIDSTTIYGTNYTALILAAHGLRNDVIKILINQHANINLANNPEGITALHAATAIGNKEGVEILINSGADISLRTKATYETALDIAKRYKYMDIVEVLTKYKLQTQHPNRKSY